MRGGPSRSSFSPRRWMTLGSALAIMNLRACAALRSEGQRR